MTTTRPCACCGLHKAPDQYTGGATTCQSCYRPENPERMRQVRRLQARHDLDRTEQLLAARL